MRIGIHLTKGSFSDRWAIYCTENNINWKPVNCYKSDILQQLNDCDALMWHFSHLSEKGILFAKQLVFSIEAAGKKVFPDFNTVWHFDDKVGQRYLLEAVGAQVVPAWIFYDYKDAIRWINYSTFPKVFKLRRGAGSQNVRLVTDKRSAKKIAKKAFGRGFPVFNPYSSLKERWRYYRLGKTNFQDVIEGVARLIIPPKYSRIMGNEKGYVYFQEFIPDNNYDIRVVVIGDKAFAIKRVVRKNDFRASGSGSILYEKEHFDNQTIQIAFETSEKLKSQCLAYDFVFQDSFPKIIEISYGFSQEGYDACPGYWDKELNWHEGKFNPQAWMVELVINSNNQTK